MKSTCATYEAIVKFCWLFWTQPAKTNLQCERQHSFEQYSSSQSIDTTAGLVQPFRIQTWAGFACWFTTGGSELLLIIGDCCWKFCCDICWKRYKKREVLSWYVKMKHKKWHIYLLIRELLLLLLWCTLHCHHCCILWLNRGLKFIFMRIEMIYHEMALTLTACCGCWVTNW